MNIGELTDRVVRTDHLLMTTRPVYDVAVIGAGVFGAWTAYLIRRTGASVILIEQYGVSNTRASSGGETRVIRTGYGPDEIYSRSAARSLELWSDFGKQVKQRLFHRTGVLWLAHEQDAYSMSTLATFARTNTAYEKLTPIELARRFPQIALGPVAWAILELKAGVLMASQGVRAVVEEATRDGVTYVEESILPPTGNGRLESVATTRGGRITAGTFVFGCGPWLRKVFPEILGELIHVTRQEVFYFGVPAGDYRFAPPAMPVWIDFSDLVYAIPDVAGRGFKIAFDAHGPEFDPDKGDRAATREGLAAVREYLSFRVPALTNAPLLGSEVCQYENTSNGDFLIDQHPTLKNVWLVGGGSGHGFKHGPAVGEYVVKRISGGSDVEPRFSLASKAAMRRRNVY
ncbi:MAG: FAD-dependent oxidoreductase [Pyrinomonadaceae bacterium]|nr:FAD-dependent oxidoreductase [Pyrinomonadaceae bacterium]